MANTTFNGPVRSENGFQELVDGVWTTVGGGGGGGGSSTAIVYTNPTDGSTVTVTLPAPTEVGTMYTVASTLATTANGQITIEATLLPGQDAAVFVGVEIVPDNYASRISRDAPYTTNVYMSDKFQFVYVGEFASEGLTYGVYNVIRTSVNLGG